MTPAPRSTTTPGSLLTPLNLSVSLTFLALGHISLAQESCAYGCVLLRPQQPSSFPHALLVPPQDLHGMITFAVDNSCELVDRRAFALMFILVKK